MNNKAKKLFLTGSGLLILLGLIHLSVHFSIVPDASGLKLMATMENYKIYLFGEHSFLKFHNGFAVYMGICLTMFGLFNLFHYSVLIPKKSSHVFNLIFALIGVAIGIQYFHLVVVVFFTLSLLCFSLSLFYTNLN